MLTTEETIQIASIMLRSSPKTEEKLQHIIRQLQSMGDTARVNFNAVEKALRVHIKKDSDVVCQVDTIKCGRVVFELRIDDYVIDNGSCYQFVRGAKSIFNKSAYSVSKEAFKKFIKLPRVVHTEEINKYCGTTNHYYIYQ